MYIIGYNEWAHANVCLLCDKLLPAFIFYLAKREKVAHYFKESKSSRRLFLVGLASKEENVYIIRLGICILRSHTHYRTKEMDSKTQVADKPHAVCIPCPVLVAQVVALNLFVFFCFVK